MLDQISNHPLMVQTNNTSSEPCIDVDTGYSYPSLDAMVQHARQLECNLVMNCTGVGSSNMCKDTSLQGGRGILLHYDRRKCHRRDPEEKDSPRDVAMFVEDLPWATSNEACYMIPRGNELLVGGSFHLMKEKMDATMMESHERERLIQNAHRLGIDTTQSDPINEWIGYRPWRPTVRVEVEYDKEMPVIHNYGHGGSGWTVFVGAVHEAVDLALKSI